MRRELGMSVALLLMCFALWLSNPDFLGHSNAINLLRQISRDASFVHHNDAVAHAETFSHV